MPGPFWVALGDFTGDGYGDMVTSDSTGNTASVRAGTAFLAVGFSGVSDGIWYLHVCALDTQGVGGTTSHRMVRINAGAPITTQNGGDDAWHLRRRHRDTSLDLGGHVARTEYRIDGGDWIEGTTDVVPAPCRRLERRPEHIVVYRSTDDLGVVEAEQVARA